MQIKALNPSNCDVPRSGWWHLNVWYNKFCWLPTNLNFMSGAVKQVGWHRSGLILVHWTHIYMEVVPKNPNLN